MPAATELDFQGGTHGVGRFLWSAKTGNDAGKVMA